MHRIFTHLFVLCDAALLAVQVIKEVPVQIRNPQEPELRQW
jgi:hypothetical protein